jgi:hypothetical protein
MDVLQPRWSTWSFLVYGGGLTVLAAAGGWLTYLAGRSGQGGYAGWALLIVLLLTATAVGFRRREHPVAAGVFAFAAVAVFAAFVAALWDWFGWQTNAAATSGFSGFHVARLLLELLWLVAALIAVRAFRFSLIVSQAVLAGWLLVTDVLSNGGNWSAVVTLLIGLSYLAAALAVDLGPSRPYGFWLHLAAGLAVGGALLWFWHGGNVEWTLIALASVAYVFFAQLVGRSSWAVLGTAGLVLAATHFTLEWTHVQLFFFNGGHGSARAWVAPLVFTCLGALLVALGLIVARRGAQVGQELT